MNASPCCISPWASFRNPPPPWGILETYIVLKLDPRRFEIRLFALRKWRRLAVRQHFLFSENYTGYPTQLSGNWQWKNMKKTLFVTKYNRITYNWMFCPKIYNLGRFKSIWSVWNMPLGIRICMWLVSVYFNQKQCLLCCWAQLRHHRRVPHYFLAKHRQISEAFTIYPSTTYRYCLLSYGPSVEP